MRITMKNLTCFVLILSMLCSPDPAWGNITADTSAVINAIRTSKGEFDKVSAGKCKLTAKFSKSDIEGVSYEAAIKKSGDSQWSSSVTTKRSKTWTNLAGGKKYSVKVRLTYTADGETYTGDWSDTVTVKVKHTTESRAREILDGMTLKEKIGQMFLSGAWTVSDANNLVKKYHVGGVLLYKNSFDGRTKSQVKNMISGIQKNSDINLMIAVDEEGGSVIRVSGNKKIRSTPFKSPRDIYAAGGWTGVRKEAKEKAKLLKSLGVNTNLAPVADLPKNSSSYIYKRAFSTDAKKTSKFVKIVVGEFEKQGEISTLKHFPGYGGNSDSHNSIVYDRRKLKTLEKHDLLPFKAGIEAGAPMVMVKHTILTKIDSKWTASLSPKIHKYLRNTLGFDGVIVTDSLTMGAAQKCAGSNAKAAVQAVIAGNDLICTNNAKGEYEAILKAVKKGKIKKSRIDESVLRILKLKLSKGIIK